MRPAVTTLAAAPPPPLATDQALVARVAGGDAVAYRQLVERHLAAVHRIAARLLGDVGEADEVTQDSFLKLWTHADRWRADPRGVLPWLRTVAANGCLDRLRRRRFVADGPVPDLADDAPGAGMTIDRRRLGSVTSAALAGLPDRQRAAIVLTYFEELPNLEAAATLEMHVKAFESLLLRARRALHATLVARGIGVDDLREMT